MAGAGESPVQSMFDDGSGGSTGPAGPVGPPGPPGSGADVFSVVTYGAVGDGAHNDTPNVRLAVLAAIAAGGGVVYFPPTANSWKLGTTLSILTADMANCRYLIFRGCGDQGPIKVATGAGNDCIVLQALNVNDYRDTVTLLDNLTFIGNNNHDFSVPGVADCNNLFAVRASDVSPWTFRFIKVIAVWTNTHVFSLDDGTFQFEHIMLACPVCFNAGPISIGFAQLFSTIDAFDVSVQDTAHFRGVTYNIAGATNRGAVWEFDPQDGESRLFMRHFFVSEQVTRVVQLSPTGARRMAFVQLEDFFIETGNAIPVYLKQCDFAYIQRGQFLNGLTSLLVDGTDCKTVILEQLTAQGVDYHVRFDNLCKSVTMRECALGTTFANAPAGILSDADKTRVEKDGVAGELYKSDAAYAQWAIVGITGAARAVGPGVARNSLVLGPIMVASAGAGDYVPVALSGQRVKGNTDGTAVVVGTAVVLSNAAGQIKQAPAPATIVVNGVAITGDGGGGGSVVIDFWLHSTWGA